MSISATLDRGEGPSHRALHVSGNNGMAMTSQEWNAWQMRILDMDLSNFARLILEMVYRGFEQMRTA